MPDMNNDELDRALDAALVRYAAVEPRPGLETRVLANLRARPAVNRSWLRWPAIAACAAAVIIVIALAWRTGRSVSPIAHDRPAIGHPVPTTQIVSTAAKTAPPQTRPAKHRGSLRQFQPESAIAAATPRLDQFPSPQPLSSEEIAIAEYVKKFPKEAQLVARAQEEFALETQKQMSDDGAETKHSIQQER